eukprot:08470.XXX_528506_529330_1 [CDS] Oithona nana genome sequencing.
MARNSEKAMTALARWRNAKLVEDGLDTKNERRPYLATQCNNLKSAEKWRIQVIREASKKMAQIQNAGLGEFRIRDLNDEINKLLREKRHWENRIIELGGRDKRSRSRMLDKEGKEVPGVYGYKYFGAARDLPGVRELFEAEKPEQPKKSRAELMKDIDAAYYGYRDDEDNLLVPLEIEAEKAAVAQAVKEWKEKREAGQAEEKGDDEPDIYAVPPDMSDMDRLEEAMREGKEGRFFAHVAIPTQKDIEQALLERKKRELLHMYDIDSDDEKETK